MNEKRASIVGTIVVNAILIALLLLLGFPLPLPSERGILINFGTSDQGMGLIEPDMGTAPAHRPAPSSQAQEAPLTQDFEEAPAIAIPKPETKPDTKPQTKPDVKPNEPSKPSTEQTKPTEEKPREVNPKALFPGQKPGGGTSGEGETGQPGNQGNPDGSVDSQSHVGDLTGGGGGDGGETSFSLAGRTASKLPKPEYPKQKGGRVVVEVTVDRNGNVTKATGGAKGSTTNDTDLVKAAERAAMLAKFNVKENAPAEQYGTITYIFKLQQ